jgi:hypothetical protein
MGTIHHEAEAIHFSKNPDHRQIVKPFLSCFDVTRGFWRERGHDRLACFYLKPEKFIAEQIGLEREMLLVYAPYQEFQARSLKLHDEVLASDRLRLDPVGSVLVTDDPNTSEGVRRFLVSEPERPPIVGLAKDDLSSIREADDLRSIFFRQLFQRDLFALEAPLKTDVTFFGRHDIVTELLDRYRSGQNSGLFGLRRIGKTSVLYAVQRRCADGEIAGAVYLDASSPALHRSRWWSVLQTIVRTASEPLHLERADRSKVRALNVEFKETDAAGHFKADILTLKQHYPGRRLVVLLDEIEHVTFGISPAAHWNEDALPLWQTMRAVHQELGGDFGFIVAGVNPRLLEADRIGNYDNPLFSTVKTFYLSPFDQATLREMVRRVGRYMGLRCDEALYQRLHEEYGGHPFIVRRACSWMARKVPERPGTLTTTLFEGDRERIALALERNAQQILNVLAIWYPDEFEMVRLLARGDKKSFVELANLSGTFIEHVEGYGLVSKPQTEPKIRIGLVRSYLERLPAKPSMAETETRDPDEVLAEISRRRNAIEKALRTAVAQGLRFGRGASAGDAVLGAVSDKRRVILVQHGFPKSIDELYFNELAAVVLSNWDAFGKFFGTEKNKVEQWFEHVNKSRADAHARSLSDEDLAFLRVCFKRLEEILGLA